VTKDEPQNDLVDARQLLASLPHDYEQDEEETP
jgi:hypothetical protein